MLQELTIDNLAIIEHLTLDFSDQMTVLTGETGAGKSIIIDAVGLLAGNRGSQEFIRHGEEKLHLQGQFTLPNDPRFFELLEELGIEHEDGTLIISREIHRNGRNVIRVNGALINTATLRKIGAHLVDIQGQNDHQQLMQPENHLHMLDQFDYDQIKPLLAKYKEAYQRYAKLKATLSRKQADSQQWAQRLDMLRYQVKEISDANLQENEEDELTSERDRLEHFQQINNALQLIAGVLNEGEAPVLDQVAQAMNEAQEIAPFDLAYDELSKSLGDAYYSLQDAANAASRQLDMLEFDDGRLEQINERLTIIGDLERKYGDTVADVLAYYQKIHAELTTMEQTADSDDELERQLAEVTKELQKLGSELSQVRQKAAHQLNGQVHQQLKELYMDKAVFEVKFHQNDSMTFYPDGIDNVEFYIQTNPGESMGPLVKIASGGELSRVMLALKTIFAQHEGVTSIIFDEVDTGVSGRVAQAIADKIKLIAQHSQVLCITHLPQVAAVAQHHFLIQKTVQNNRTTTHVTILKPAERINELARMISGEEITKLSREHAKELLQMANS
ncbi:DNA repair protein RecN [Limosilactobacillus mucosae]|uniref:DNA repair protein RecN n=1 Tax=Limosilactobacillus mucosae TaxID=97478 RepID=UPI00233F4D66|nr:DNA repair protein RecN [Limosilactobacillus mucosae]MDC2838354.1 DNA repair protein RecN [Limosilactobacillus mucosae]